MSRRTDLGMPAFPPFPEAAAEAVRDPVLRANLRRATRTIRERRARAVAELADWAELREAGKRVKDQALHRLDQYLEELERTVTAAGGTVHWAADATEANRIVADLVKATGETEVVKVKSMATQEIGLNEALAAEGITAHETDLAELIVQLGDDRPSHILVPAIHRNRAEIREIFAREMGRRGRAAPDGLTDEPADLAEAARLHLREKFLRAKVGVSGANFLVAETGTVVVVESEGNGRMCLTLPETLITVAGVEKTVPTRRDLEIFLQTLPRSSTAERMNPYTSMWTGTTDGDGPSAFHLVLVDNGRTGVLADPVGRQALRCIRCSACLNVCPVYERAGGHAYGSVYPGPIGAILGPQLRGTADPVDASLPYASTLCGACYDVCPVAIDIPEVLVRLRTRIAEDPEGKGRGGRGRRGPRRERAAFRAAGLVLAHPAVLAAVERLLGATRSLHPARPPGLSPWTDGRALPRLPERSFRAWWREHRENSAPPRAADDERTAAVPTEPATARPAVAESDPSAPSRDRILARIRSALEGAPEPPEIRRDYAVRHTADAPSALTDLLSRRLTEYRATVHRTTHAELPALVARVLAAHHARSVVVPPGLPAHWLTATDATRLTDDDPAHDGPLTPAALDRADAVITGCALAVAETGTIVLDGGPAQGRRALTLVPDLHLCVVRAPAQLAASVPEALPRLTLTRPLTWISGPSATSDIELDRVEGVHGPRRLEVLLCEG